MTQDRLLRISYKDHVTNEEVRAKMQREIEPHEDLLTIVKRRKLQWYGHVSRSSGVAKTILQGTVKGGRSQGRQKKRWKDNIREWTGLGFGKSQRAVENREKWRKLVAKSSVMPKRPSRLRDWWWWWWRWWWWWWWWSRHTHKYVWSGGKWACVQVLTDVVSTIVPVVCDNDSNRDQWPCPRGLTFTWWGCCGYCLWHKPSELANSFFLFFYSVLLSISVFMALSAVFHSTNSPDNFPLSHPVLPVIFLPYWSFQLYTSLWKSASALIWSFYGWQGLTLTRSLYLAHF